MAPATGTADNDAANPGTRAMIRHGLQLSHPAITASLEARTLASVVGPNRKCYDGAPKRHSGTRTHHGKCARLTQPAPLLRSARPTAQTSPKPKSP